MRVKDATSINVPCGYCDCCGHLFYPDDPYILKGNTVDPYDPTKILKCPICDTELKYNPYSPISVGYIEGFIPVKYSFEHLNQLADDATLLQNAEDERRLSLMMRLIAHAQHFIHFETRSIDTFFLALLYLASYRVSVKGMVGCNYENVETQNGYMKPLFRKEYVDEFDYELNPAGYAGYRRTYAGNADIHFDPRPDHESVHRKTLLIDGLVMIKGSANFTINAWTTNIEGEDSPTVLSDLSEIGRLNNEKFAKSFYLVKSLRRTESAQHIERD